MRIACLLVPNLPLLAELRANSEWIDRPLVITSGPGTRAEIITASQEALDRGVRIRQSLPQARAVCPDLTARVASPVLEQAARQALLDVGLSLAPRAELAPRASGHFISEGVLYVDASGVEALHRNEKQFASMLHARTERAGLAGVVSIASSRSIARLVARHLVHVRDHDRTHDRVPDEDRVQTCVLEPEDEWAFLDPLPIDLLDPDDRTAQALTHFGIQRIRDLLRLSRRDLAARLGPQLLELVSRARGEEIESPLPEPRALDLEEGIDLEAPIGSLEALAFVFRGLVSRLVDRLRLRSLGCGELRLELRLENGARENRRIGMASAHQDERVLLRLLRLALESEPPRAAIEGLRLTSQGVPLRREQLDLFLPRGPSPGELDQTLAELASLCGTERVGRPVVVDSHRPDVFALQPFAPGRNREDRRSPNRRSPRRQSARGRSSRPGPTTHTASDERNSPQTGPPQRKFAPATKNKRRYENTSRPRPVERPVAYPKLTLRALRPPVRAHVRIERGKPVFLRSAVSQGEVVVAAGPWRTTGGWWAESEHFAVDHYDVQMSDGTVLRLRFDWKLKWWQIDGLYD